jgi:peroxiredoxin
MSYLLLFSFKQQPMRIRFTLFFLLFLTANLLFAQKAPDFKLKRVDGSQINLYEDYLDKGKSVVIEVFFSACGPCNTMAPYFGDLHTKLKDKNVNVEFISLSLGYGGDNETMVKEFKNKYNHDWPFVAPEGGSVEALSVYTDGTYGQFFGTPSTNVISPDGTVNYNVRGSIGNDWINKLEAAIIESQTANNNTTVPPMTVLRGGISTYEGEGLAGVTINFSGGKDTSITTGVDGGFESGNLVIDTSYTIALEKNTKPVNGVTTLDIVLASRHILGIEEFTEDHQKTAGDVNNSGGITTFDLVVMRQLILGIIDEFPNRPSWVFEPAELKLESLNDLEALVFKAIKIGDLNSSAKVDELTHSEPRTALNDFLITVKNQKVNKGETVLVEFAAEDIEEILGMQFTLDFDINALQLEALDTRNLKESNFNLERKEQGLISLSWNKEKKVHKKALFALTFRAKKAGDLNQFLHLNSKLTKKEAFNADLELMDVALAFEKVEKNNSVKAQLFPNPVEKGIVNLTLQLEKKAFINVLIQDLNGKILKQQQGEFQKGTSSFALKMEDLEAGIYFVQIFENNRFKEGLKVLRLSPR